MCLILIQRSLKCRVPGLRFRRRSYHRNRTPKWWGLTVMNHNIRFRGYHLHYRYLQAISLIHVVIADYVPEHADWGMARSQKLSAVDA